ncbi:electron transfer flavoprotein subunit beta/FixA family protein [Desulfosarcina sp. OttesenSCG-928-A07]|nr:electron transfer flavoprotein subunit beta/FixA family protein [Desulfosarcina sp. OttesenSCG-928-G17]MDL2329938.1 electron transfer flavoprotein subunit beta/FixA family protein [Desulfosarcina sp. OttesenSCG-928-A07]
MHSIVCIKSVVLSTPKGRMSRSPEKSVLNPFDRWALEMALQIKEAHGGTVTALSMGPPASESILREAMAMGVDQGVLLCDRAFAASDTLATSRSLTAAVRHLSPFDFLLFGVCAADSDTGQVGPQTASFLDIPMVGHVTRVESANGVFTLHRQLDGFLEQYELASPPVAMTIHPAAVEPRDPTLGALGTAFDSAFPITCLDIAAVGLEPRQVGVFGSPTRVLSVKPVDKKRVCEWIQGDPAIQADILVEKLVKAGLVG